VPFLRFISASNINKAEHNINSDFDIPNPSLTKVGFEQAKTLGEVFVPYKRITHILCSPMKRTIQTAMAAFEPLLRDGLNIVCWGDLRECGATPASIGDNRTDLKRYINKNPINVNLLEEDWQLPGDNKARAALVRL
jgi:broad specificity phosphatase PhoE